MNIDNIRGLFSDEEAVSPVIGVILMVAITVILAAVIGTFVLGLGDQATGSTAPNVNFAFDYNSSSSTLNVTHDGGDSVQADRLSWAPTSGVSATTDFSGEVTAGDTAELDVSGLSSGDTVRVVWTAQSGDSSQTIGSFELP